MDPEQEKELVEFHRRERIQKQRKKELGIHLSFCYIHDDSSCEDSFQWIVKETGEKIEVTRDEENIICGFEKTGDVCKTCKRNYNN